MEKRRQKKITIKMYKRVDKDGETTSYIRATYNRSTTNFAIDIDFITQYISKNIEGNIVRIIRYLEQKNIDFNIKGIKGYFLHFNNKPSAHASNIISVTLLEELGNILSYNNFRFFMYLRSNDVKPRIVDQLFTVDRLCFLLETKKINVFKLVGDQFFKLLLIEDILIEYDKSKKEILLDWIIDKSCNQKFLLFFEKQYKSTLKKFGCTDRYVNHNIGDIENIINNEIMNVSVNYGSITTDL